MYAAPPWEALDRARASGGAELVLYRCGGEFVIRADGWELMSTAAHGSEEALALAAGPGLLGVRRPRVLLGGLGFGFTLRSLLGLLPEEGEVLVAELVPAVVDWMRGPAGGAAGFPLADGRVQVLMTDVAVVLAEFRDELDAVLLDVDNGPSALCHPGNDTLYGCQGLAAAFGALRPGGCLAIWSAGEDPGLAARMRDAGFRTEVLAVPPREGITNVTHAIFIGRRATEEDSS